MRIENSIKNIKYNSIFFIINSLLSFLLKSVLIFFIGAEFSGLNSVLKNLLGLLNVAELGISTAVTYSLYGFIREKQYDKINSILAFYKKIYVLIGITVGFIAAILLLFINKIIRSNEISEWQVGCYFIAYSIMIIFSYFSTYMQILVVADQKGYIITRINGIISIIKISLQIIIAIIFRSYALFISIEILLNIYTYILLNKKLKEIYSYIDLKNNKNLKELINENKDIFNNTKNLMVHKLASMVVFQTDTIVLSTFTDLMTVAMYSNYYFITSMCQNFVYQILSGVSPSAGDLIAEGDNEKTFKIWRELYLLNSFIAVVISFCIFKNINKFITLWVGNEFLFNNYIVLAIIISLFISIIRIPTDIFKEGYGLFEDRWAPIAESIINLVVSIYLVNKVGIIGVFIGTITSSVIIVLIWKPYMVFNYGFKKSISEYFKIVITELFIAAVDIFCSNYILSIIHLSIKNDIICFFIDCVLSLFFIISIYILTSIFHPKHRELYKKYMEKYSR